MTQLAATSRGLGHADSWLPDHDAGLLRGDRRERPAGQHDADGDPAVVQVPGRGPAAAVAPGPGEHDIRPRCDEGLPDVSQVPPRVSITWARSMPKSSVMDRSTSRICPVLTTGTSSPRSA
jgi:hypothetical protein